MPDHYLTNIVGPPFDHCHLIKTMLHYLATFVRHLINHYCDARRPTTFFEPLLVHCLTNITRASPQPLSLIYCLDTFVRLLFSHHYRPPPNNYYWIIIQPPSPNYCLTTIVDSSPSYFHQIATRLPSISHYLTTFIEPLLDHYLTSFTKPPLIYFSTKIIGAPPEHCHRSTT